MQYSDILGAFGLAVLLFGLLVALYLHPIKKAWAVIARLIPKKPVPAEQPSDDAEDEENPLDAFATGNEAGEAAAEADFNTQDNDNPVPAEHARFMPPAALDDFGEPGEARHDEDVDAVTEASAAATAPAEEEMSETVGQTIPEQIEDEAAPAEDTEKDAYAAKGSEALTDTAATNADEKSADGPELVVVNSGINTGTTTAAEPRREIRNGDHIGLDEPYDVRAGHSRYQFPPLDLLIERPNSFTVNEEEQEANKNLIVNALRSYNVEIEKINATIGPTVTLYEIVPVQGTRISKIKSLEDDIAMNLAAYGIRIIAPIPGKGSIGLEVPNRKPQIVSMRTILESDLFRNTTMKLPMVLGATISNDIYMVDLAKMPHLLVAGATGQGKSVGLNCIITSLLYSKHPDELKFVLIDPKMVEFSLYSAIDRQYLAKIPEEESAVITDPNKALDTLNSLCVEMDDRYQLLRTACVRSLEEYNAKFCNRMLSPEQGHRFLPYIVMIVDEYADLVVTAGNDISKPICRIAQKARAVGMHMIIATQRPSTDIITGKIKANFPARIAFKVTQGVDSKTILDRPGAQRLIGRGDMLVMTGSSIDRVQCAFVDTPEVEAICSHIASQPGFAGCYLLPDPPAEEAAEVSPTDMTITDEFRKCALYIATQSQASITMLQRKFEIGFNKAGRFMDQMQQLGIVGPANGAKPRQVLMQPDEVERLLG
ncbi:MAG: DNA translocase FtsK [Muribaculaceae bacterium]|nr:DNA translocase FtsK [Muribaculaceae bacterium]